jgi:hypothetical protein
MTDDELDPELMALIDAAFPRPKPPKPKVVVSDDVVVRDVDVVLSRDDINTRRRGSEVVQVHRPEPEWLTQELPRGRFDRVTLNLSLAEVQHQERQRSQAALAPPDKFSDPMNVWGRKDD